MKYSLNIVKSMVGVCILLNTPLLSYASSCKEKHNSCNRGHSKRQSSKCCKVGPQGEDGKRGCRGKQGDKGDRGRRGKQGDPGNNGINGTSFVSTFGSWFDNANFTVTLPVTTPPAVVPFVGIAVDGKGITNIGGTGTFLFSETGYYLVEFGVVVRTVSDLTLFLFALQLDGSNVPGGALMAEPRDFPNDTPWVTLPTTSVILHADAGQVLSLAYINSFPTSGGSVQIGPSQPTNAAVPTNPANTALITITQIQ